jgi:hypothetical protein
MKVRTASPWHSCIVPTDPLMCNQGFCAEIPDAYLFALQNNLQQADSEIAYIGKTDTI